MTAINTSDDNWHAAITRVYRSQGKAFINDDAKIGIDPANDTLFVMGQKAHLSVREWAAVLVALGLGGGWVFGSSEQRSWTLSQQQSSAC